MAISFDNALGIHEQALLMREQRSGLLAANIANSDTPGYKARDLDFRALLQDAFNGGALGAETTDARHIGVGPEATPQPLYRVPSQPSVDGNTVDAQLENAAFSRNALEHQASFQFLNGKFTGLMKALKGE
ncbi:MAG: flagellar basal body rod protein FlgB [Pseudomonadota bacterium]